MRTIMPLQKPGKSRQCYSTPRDFMRAVEARFGPMQFDLAATARNAKAPLFYTQRQDSLRRQWEPLNYRFWLNPPFRNIRPWAEKCEEVAAKLKSRGSIFFLVPASVCSQWFMRHVFRVATVNLLYPRLSFIGDQNYPKDLILAVYRRKQPSTQDQFLIWDWRQSIIINQRGTLNVRYKRLAA